MNKISGKSALTLRAVLESGIRPVTLQTLRNTARVGDTRNDPRLLDGFKIRISYTAVQVSPAYSNPHKIKF